tara:strand:- start:1700 stop:1801 length:102 start_codon:yes stop_codon:yes gene_type:complete
MGLKEPSGELLKTLGGFLFEPYVAKGFQMGYFF